MRRLKIVFVCKLAIYLLSWSIFVGELHALRGSAVVLQAKSKAEKKISDDEVAELDENGELNPNATVASTKPTLTGIPQIDYVHDPNLPRELNGYNLTDYPFLNSVPEEIDFKCDGLHDGFYASVPHKCQLYHHCLFGTRYDFLCANYTAFDQKTFICHFVSQVDCNNSAKYFNRNEALYKAAETTTTSTTTTSTTTAAPPPPPPPPSRPQQQPQQQFRPYEGRRVVAGGYAQGRKHRPYRRRRPVYEYYYVDDEYDDAEYYDDAIEPIPVVKKSARKHSRVNNYKPVDLENEYVESSSELDRDNNEPIEQQHQQQRASSSVIPKNVSNNQIMSVYGKPRAPPKIRRPVPLNERDRYDYIPKANEGSQQPLAASTTTSTTTTSTTTTTTESPAKSKGKIPPPPVEPEYYDEEEEEYVEEDDVDSKEVVNPLPAKVAPTKDFDNDKLNKRQPVALPSSTIAPKTPLSVFRPKLTKPLTVQPSPVLQHQSATVLKKRPVERVDEYEDELPVATRQTTTKRTSGVYTNKSAVKTKGPVARSPVSEEAVYHQPQRVSVRQSTRHRQEHNKPTRMVNRRPARPTYEYEYYDE
ncbi:uncharacterized protein LOC126910260 [Daktulosphaira vitifoliae]|uniref:uncharacterized protein LOC126910260 n=1 Tax=Daktulosphaira vitifoliae TaxID=58002 RepID=UPI0021A9F507|nr:uncharacterized protein LOC126910260 [Daktulosphaira vitifoliae]XP_050548622.1 uncharacterized protein LOC126910260 [Daktulosphaira vitifoliae]